MRLKVGDILYLNPNTIWNEMYKYKGGEKASKSDLIGRPFMVNQVRERGYLKFHEDDICIRWIDDTDWWWGQIGSSEPWTKKFITEKEYLRNKKINELLDGI
jgi:hypothetical protein